MYKKILFFLFLASNYFFLNFLIAEVVAERPIVVIVPSYNNSDWVHVNLSSIFFQKYFNYRVIYIDDNSTDDTYKLVENYAQKHEIKDKITIIKNTKRLYAAENRYNAIYLCQDDEIIVNLDGDDWFSRDDVLSEINEAYKDSNVWMTYGNFLNWPSNLVGYGKNFSPDVIKNRSFRHYKWVVGQPRTFYAGLFKLIKKEDLMINKKFVKSATDVAMMYPILEMVGNHFKFINKISYIRNVATDLNLFKTSKKEQRENTKYFCSQSMYQQLEKLSFDTEKNIVYCSYKMKIIHGSQHQWSLEIVEKT